LGDGVGADCVARGAGDAPSVTNMKRHTLYKPQTFRAAAALANWLPASAMRWMARRIADANYFCVPRFRRVVRENLTHVINSTQPLGPIVRENFRNFGESLVDYVRCERLRCEQLAEVLAGWRGLDVLDAALAQKRGALIVTAHLGNWELGGVLFALQGYPIHTVTLEEQIDELTDMRENYRRAHGVRTIRIGKSPFSAVEIIKALEQNAVIAMLVDRPPENSAVTVKFFGAPAKFSSAPAVLAHLTGVPVLPAFIVGVGNGRYRASIEPPVAMERGSSAEIIAQNTQKIAAIFESVIARHADQWYQFVPIWEENT
jgi:lauroyl/myristoyl acyltransferase